MRHGGKRTGARLVAFAAIALAGAATIAGPLSTSGARGALAADRNPVAFVETFDGRPAAPEPFRSASWDVTYVGRDFAARTEPLPIAAHHGPDCSAAPATHEVRDLDALVYRCNDHLMTALNGGSYGLIYLTPNHLVDFSAGEAVISFDMSTFRGSPRDWIDLWITPYDEHLQVPGRDREPGRSIHVSLDGFNFFSADDVRGFAAQSLRRATDIGYETVLSPSAVRRDTFELRISRTHLKFGMPQYNLWWIDTPLEDLGWDRGVVQFGHQSYDPTKCDRACGPNTWHWDGISISPAVPFTMIKADRRYVNEKTEPTVTFAAPAPPDSNLRFAAVGDFEISFDGGASWSQASPRPIKRHQPELFSSYWLPIPEGTQQVQFRGQQWHASDLSIWSLSQVGQTVGASCGAADTCPNEGGAEE